mgnify:CR=1 FL=1
MPLDLPSALVTLLVTVDPLGLSPIFLALTRDHAARDQRRIAAEACLAGFGILAGTALLGRWLLAQLGIDMASFRIAGGLLLFAIAFEMIFDRRQSRKDDAAQRRDSPAMFPLAIPLLAGPGAMTATVLLAGRAGGDPLGMTALLLIIALVLMSAYIAFRLAPGLARIMGSRGQIVFHRLLGVILAALAVQYVIDGLLAISRAH